MQHTVESLQHQRDLLAKALGELLQAQGIIRSDEPVALTGPQLLLIAGEATEFARSQPKPLTSPDNQQHIKAVVSLQDWSIAEDEAEELKGEQLDPAAVGIEITESRITLDVKMPSGGQHMIDVERDKGMIVLRAYVSDRDRSSAPAKPDEIPTHDEPIMIARLGTSSSFFTLDDSQGAGRERAKHFDFDHQTCSLDAVPESPFYATIEQEQKAAAEAAVLPKAEKANQVKPAAPAPSLGYNQ